MQLLPQRGASLAEFSATTQTKMPLPRESKSRFVSDFGLVQFNFGLWVQPSLGMKMSTLNLYGTRLYRAVGVQHPHILVV